ncbi:MAG TPA: choice-of-anchor tandem repeat GloVer-containing protein [Candidatus Sulfotelmatobacter sp.]
MTFRAKFFGGGAVSVAILLLSSAALCQIAEQVTYSFNGKSGSDPRTNLVFGPSGKVYGMTTNGGINGNPDCGKGGCGVVFELTPKTTGNWGYQGLYPFKGGTDGFAPYGNIVFDAEGNLYGTTSAGGTYNQGTVFKLTPSSSGQWTETILYSFSGTDINGDGSMPRAGLTQDAKGNLYGTTYSGGTTNNGAVFELSPNQGGTWSESIIYSFLGGNSDGAAPSAEVTFDALDNLYGTTTDGGSKLMGVVFELTLNLGGGWDETLLYSFPGQNLAASRAPVWLDSSGIVYGTTCGQFPNQGTVFALGRSAGVWKEKTLHTFGKSSDGSCPISGLMADSKGNLYGTATLGGANNDGIVYEMVKGTAGAWSEKTLYNFSGADGNSPWAGITVKATTLYGTTTAGGSANFGAVYKLTQ